MAIKRTKLLEITQTAYPGITEIGLAEKLNNAGYTTERLTQAQANAKAFESALDAQHQAKNKQKNISADLKEATKEQIAEFRAWRKAVKTVDSLHNTDYYQQLELTGKLPTHYSGFLPHATHHYNRISEQPDLMTHLPPLGFSSERLQKNRDALQTLQEINRQQEQAIEEAQVATQQLETLQKAVLADLRALKKTLQTISTPERQQEHIPSLGLDEL